MAAPKKDQFVDEAHKEALAAGRAQARAVRRYLSLIDQGYDVTADPPDTDALQQRVAELQQQIEETDDPVDRVAVIQQRLEVEHQLAQSPQEDVAEVEAEFVEHAAAFAERKGLSYPAFRELGVPASVLKQAGIRRTNRPKV